MSPDPAHPQHRRPLWVASLVTVFATPVVVTLLLYALDPFVDEELLNPDGDVLEEFVVMLAGGIPISAFSMCVIALPLILVLRRLGWLIVPAVLAVTALAGAAGLLGAARGFFGTRMGLEGLSLGAGMGVVAGVVFSLVAAVGFGRKPPAGAP